MNRATRCRLLPIIVLTILSGIAGSGRASAQEATYKFDIGASLGMSGYLGDVNQASLYKNAGFAGQLSFRYIADTRWAVRAAFTTAGLKGNSAQFTNKFPGELTYDFTSQIYDLGARVEFNFLPYGMGETFKRLKRWTPYVAVGAGVCMSAVNGGTWVTMSVPLSAGVKYKPAERLNLWAEFTMAKTLGDHLDGSLADLQGIKSSFAKNTDWYSTITIGISYEFGKRCETCHYQD